MRATFKHPLPPTLNEQIRLAKQHYWRAGETKKEWTESVALEAKAANIPSFPGRVWLSFTFRVKNFGRDHDNIEASKKYLMDGLVHAGILSKDSLMVTEPVIVEFFEKAKKDEVEITISTSPLYELIPLPDN